MQTFTRRLCSGRMMAPALLIAVMGFAQSGPRPVIDRSVPSEKNRDIELEAAIRRALEPIDEKDQSLRYYHDSVDLNGDAKPEMLVYVAGRSVCGSGGCTALVFQKAGSDYQLITQIPLARAPIIVSSHRTQGWKDLILFVAGGGVQGGYYAVLPFDGAHYPENPSVAPARALKQNAHGTAYISNPAVNGPGIPLRADDARHQ